jgi:hypothetical protein
VDVDSVEPQGRSGEMVGLQAKWTLLGRGGPCRTVISGYHDFTRYLNPVRHGFYCAPVWLGLGPARIQADVGRRRRG